MDDGAIRHDFQLHDDNYYLFLIDFGIPTSYIRSWKSSFQLGIHHTCISALKQSR